MSIIGTLAEVEVVHWAELWIPIPLALAGLFLAAFLGVFRRRSIIGPPRLRSSDPLGLLLLLLGCGLMLWVFLQVLCLFPMKSSAAATTQATQPATLPIMPPIPATQPAAGMKITPGRMALATSLPLLVAALFLFVGNIFIRPGGLAGLGLSFSHIRPGVKTGLIASLIAIPLVYASAGLTQELWRIMHYTHPKEHDLLRFMREADSDFIVITLIASAVICAPLFEEILFRGHLQTLVCYTLSRFRSRISPRGPQRGFEVTLPDPRQGSAIISPDAVEQAGFHPTSHEQGGEAPPLPQAVLHREYPEPTQAARWAAVAFTSLAFALVHPAWTIPPIFLLALCLGYAYERTGNLWTTITMHAAFNTTSTILYFAFVR